MLSLESPFYEIEKTLIYRDHAVPTMFYYAAPNPQIARSGGRLMFDIFAYTVALEHSALSGTTIPDEMGAGFLTMGVECVVSQNVQRAIRQGLAAETDQPEDSLQLVAIPYRSGKASVIALDRFQHLGADEEPGDVRSSDPLRSRPTFVEDILGAATPSLLGNLRTIMSLRLSQNGVAFLQGLYADRAAPVGIVYELEFLGLRPTIEAKITANLSRVHKHFGGGLGVQYGFVRAEVEAGLDYLEEQNVVKVELTSQAVGEEAQKSKELALSLFKDRIIQEMFRPTSPQGQTPQLATALANTATATGGTQSSESNAMVSLTFRFNLTYDDRDYTYDFRERSPETRTHAPQGFLPLMVSEAAVQERTHVVSLGSEIFELLDVLVTGPSQTEFQQLGIREITFELVYGQSGDPVDPKKERLTFRGNSTGDKTIAITREGRPSLAYDYTITYEFERRSGIDSDHLSYPTPARRSTERGQLINPFRDFGILKVELEPGRIHSSIREVDVLLEYESPSGKFDAEQHLRFSVPTEGEERSPLHWQVRTQETELSAYTVTNTFVFTDNTAYTTAPESHTDELLLIDAPFQQERSLLIRPNVVANTVTRIALDIEYDDEVGDYHRRFLVEVQSPFASTEFTWPILDPNHQLIRYRETTFEPGFTHEGEWVETSDSSIIVGEKNIRVVTVTVRLIGPSLSEEQIDALLITIQQLPEPDPPVRHELFFDSSPAASQTVALTVAPDTALRYRYQTTSYKSDGQIFESDWQEMDRTILPIPVRRLTPT